MTRKLWCFSYFYYAVKCENVLWRNTRNHGNLYFIVCVLCTLFSSFLEKKTINGMLRHKRANRTFCNRHIQYSTTQKVLNLFIFSVSESNPILLNVFRKLDAHFVYFTPILLQASSVFTSFPSLFYHCKL